LVDHVASDSFLTKDWDKPRSASRPPGFIPPCLPTPAPTAPSGNQWWHEIKHDGIRVIARKEEKRVKLYSRPGNDLTHRFPQIVKALARLRSRSCIIDGEAVAWGDDGIALFEPIRYRRHDGGVFMWAFDIIELNGDDLRRERLEASSSRRRSRKKELAYHHARRAATPTTSQFVR
jgi:bifunctional non-homologous end joining protein LigD